MDSADFMMSFPTVKSVLGFDDEDQAKVESLIGWITETVNLYAGRETILKRRTVQLDGRGGDTIYLPVAPIVEVHSVKVSTSRDFDNVEALDPGLYRVSANAGMIELFRGSFPSGKGIILVDYTAGYAQDNYPANIQRYALECIQSSWDKQVNRAIGLRSKSFSDGENVQYDFEVPILTKRAFESLRLENM